MKAQLSNPYWPILIGPLAFFVALACFGLPADWITLPDRFIIFGMLGYAGARYAGRSPALIWDGNISPEARNVVGWGIYITSQMMVQIYSVIYVSYERPKWLSSAYYNPAFLTLSVIGLALVVSSVPRFPGFGGNPKGLSTAASFFVGFLSAASLFVAAHLPVVAKGLAWMLGALSHAFP